MRNNQCANAELVQQAITAIHHPGKDNITTTTRLCASSSKQKRHKTQNSIKRVCVRG